MDDIEIVKMFLNRDENAARQAYDKYAKYCGAIANSVLENAQDAEEAVNDALMAAWNSIPPNRPENLKTYLGKLTRRIALNKYRDTHADKRGGTQVALCLDELAECLSAKETVEEITEFKALAGVLNRFVRELPDVEQRVFLRRYWYFDEIDTIARRFGMGKSKVKTMLFRTRKKLKTYLDSHWEENQ